MVGYDLSNFYNLDSIHHQNEGFENKVY